MYSCAEAILAELNHGDGLFRDDCDGLAYLTAPSVRPFCDDAAQDYLVTVIYDPTVVPIEGSAHVLNSFKHQGRWRLFSNAALEPEAWDTPCTALYDNGYYRGWCRGARLKHIEVRSAELKPLAVGLQSRSTFFACDLSAL